MDHCKLPSEAQAEAAEKTSALLWQISWEKHGPTLLPNTEIMFRNAAYAEAMNFIQTHQGELLTENEREGNFLSFDSSAAKEYFLKKNADIFFFEHVERGPIGIFIGNPMDWSTYYFRYINVLPAYRGLGLAEKSIQLLLKILQGHQVERVHAEVSLSNLRQVARLTNLYFNVTGHISSERWGSMVIMTHFLSQKHEKVFLNNFCQGLRPQEKRALA